jgi:hypothetical protein
VIKGDKMDKEKLQKHSDEELIKIITEDYRSYTSEAIKEILQELKKRDYELDGEVLDDINQYLQIAELSDDKLIEIQENQWNHPKSLVEAAEKEIIKREINVDEKDFENHTKGYEKPIVVSRQNKNEGFASFLDVVGYLTIIIGVIAALVLLAQFSKPGMFSDGKISGTQLLTAVGVGFYHFVFGILCIGVAKVLKR